MVLSAITNTTVPRNFHNEFIKIFIRYFELPKHEVYGTRPKLRGWMYSWWNALYRTAAWKPSCYLRIKSCTAVRPYDTQATLEVATGGRVKRNGLRQSDRGHAPWWLGWHAFEGYIVAGTRLNSAHAYLHHIGLRRWAHQSSCASRSSIACGARHVRQHVGMICRSILNRLILRNHLIGTPHVSVSFSEYMLGHIAFLL